MTIKAPTMSDAVLDFVAMHARRSDGIEKVILFGSRARGDAQERSDYDFAVDAPSMSNATWVAWKNALISSAPTLLALDLILITSDLPAELLTNIKKEGKIIYVKNST